MVARYNEVIFAGGLCTLVNEAAAHSPSESWHPAKSEIEHLVSLGATIHSSCAELRGSMAFSDSCFEPFLTSLVSRGVAECFVLSTCNRVELYAVARNHDVLLQALSAHCGRPAEELSRMLQKRKGPEVVSHLFSVCSGIDSAVLGETEIVSQLKTGWQIAEDAGTVGPILGTVLRMALATGKRVRSETTISRAVTSIASLAMREASRRAKGLHDKRLLIVGAGAAAMSAVKYLVEHLPAEA
ncbi:MAG TPA: hypothetical protein VNI20_00320, partial [Fimbriimonadaceae bacterium]|nr:hypothetical protein [Fimbriimonadaceae bacterium]